jgi:hypothetical protein
MQSKSLFLIAFLLISLSVIGQNSKNLDLRFGAGISILGTGDLTTFNYENELNLKFNKYFTGSVSLNLGKGNSSNYRSASFIQGNINVLISPFTNVKRFDFRVGTGLSLYGISDIYQSDFWVNNTLYENYKFDRRSSFGFNVIIENSYLLNDKYMIGLKIFSQPYFNGDINSGMMLKLGIKL